MYKSELKDELHKVLMQFFKEDQGNRVTSFNTNGLIGTVNAALEKFEVKPKEKKSPKRRKAQNDNNPGCKSY